MVYKTTLPSVPIPDIDLYSFLVSPNEFNTNRDLNAPIVIEGATGKSLSWNTIKEQSRLLGTGWQENVGLKPGDTVAVFAPNQLDHVILVLSLLAAKVTISPGNPAYTEAEFEHQLGNCQARTLVTVPELLPVLRKICTKLGIQSDRIFLFGDKEVDGCRPYKSIIGKTPVSLPLQGIKPNDDIAFVSYSSGTTGLAKGVMLSHQNFVAQVLQVTNFDPNAARDDDVVLGFLPFYHIYGLTSLILNVFYRVTPVVIMERYDLELLCQLIEKYKITIAAIVPPVAVHLAKSPIVEKYNLTSVRLLGCGAAPLGREHIESLAKRIPAKLKQGYGMTETTSGVITQRLEDGVAGSIGILVSNMECKIVDAENNEVGDNQEGELLFRGPSVMKGYLNNPKANAETFTADGWMRTGDVGKYDSKTGEFAIVDRIKELIKFKGFQVAPAELEALLMSNYDIADCCVVGIYDNNQATELPRAYIVLQPGIEKSAKTAKAIEDFVAANVTNYKKLRGGVVFVDAIPKSPSGKILRRQVKDWVKNETVKARL